MPGRTFSADEYRYGFNGKEKDPEGMGGGGTTYDYGFRIYNPGIAKFLSVDPLTASYPWYTPYQFAGNIPIQAIDLDGGEPKMHYEFKKFGTMSVGNGFDRIVVETEIYDLTEREFRKEMLKYQNVLKYNFIAKNDNDKHVFDNVRAWEAALTANNIDAKSKVSDISNEVKKSIFQTFREYKLRAFEVLNDSYYDSYYFNSQMGDIENERFINKVAVHNRKVLQEYRENTKSKAISDIAWGTVSTGFGIYATIKSGGLASSSFGAASSFYGIDKISGGINILVNINNLPFEPNKDYRMIGGLIQENFGDDFVLYYDLAGIGIDLVNIAGSGSNII